MGESDRNLAQGNCCSLSTYDVTNRRAFLSVSIIDRFQRLSLFKASKATEEMTDNITEFPQKCNCFGDVSKCFDMYKAYTILIENILLKNNFNFSKELIVNFQLYSYGTQTKIRQELVKLQSTLVSEKRSKWSFKGA